MKPFAEEDTQSELLENEKGNKAPDTKAGRDYSSIIDKDQLKKKKRIKYGIIGLLILIVIILAIVLPLTLKKKDSPYNPPITYPHYNPYSTKSSVFLQSNMSGVIQAPDTYDHDLHIQALNRVIPVLKDGTKKLGIDSKGIPKGDNNLFIKNLNFQFDLVSWRVAHLVITDDDKPRFSIPEQAVPKPKGDNTMRLDMIGVEFEQDPFSFTFKDPVNPDNVLLTTKGQSLVVMDKFIQMDFQLPSQRVYGFGERVHDFQLEEGTWTMWAIGLDSPVDDGTGRKGTYGVHPFVLVQTQNKGDYIGMFFRNSNAQSPVLKYQDDGTSILSYITIGGQIEVYFFVHGSAKSIVQQYQSMFGKPNLPPFWTLGWQQASWKYINQDMVEEVIDNYFAAGMPLETMYLDIPYMKSYKDFSVDTKAFGDIQGLAKRLHDANQKLVVILDAAISADDVNDDVYQKGSTELDIFIKSSMYKSKTYNNNIISKVWPDKAVFIDWFNPKSLDFWTYGLQKLRDLVDYDGIWIDMNEPTTFGHGEIKPEDAEPVTPTLAKKRLMSDDGETVDWYYEFKDQSVGSTFTLPFIPGYVQSDDGKPGPYNGNFDYMTLSLNSTIPSLGETSYNVHSLYGLMMAKRTFEHVTKMEAKRPDERPYILTRSTFASSGRYASHWLGDNWRKWEYMRYSIAGMMNMNMFGLPHVGADVCGFFGKTKDDEMCARWIQLATFYPLARAHQNLTFEDTASDRSEPYLLTGQYKQWALQSIRDRFHHLRHMYTCLFEVSQNGGSCIDPLFYYYPDDDNLYDDTTSTFMVGGAIKVSPILEVQADGVKTFKSYFPKGNWVSLSNFAAVVQSKGEMKDLPNSQATVHAHLRPGSLVSWQNTINSKGAQIMTTSELITQPISLIINRDDNNYATGSLFLDTGIKISEITSKSFEYYQIIHQVKSIQLMLSDGTRGSQSTPLDQIIITNADDLKYTNFACYMDNNKEFHSLKTQYNDITNSVYLTAVGGANFHDVLNVFYGQLNKDLNMCDPKSWEYQVDASSVLPDLNATSQSVVLKHSAGILPNIEVQLRVIETDIVNVKWSWKLDKDGKTPNGYRVPPEVPNDLIDTDKPDAVTKLASFLTVQDNPFQVNFKYRSASDPSNVFSIKGMIFDQYLNWINVQANTMPGDDFQGILGLGERANKDFFLKDGVYSMWSRDQPTPEETGTLPGSNMYGTHPFFMYKHKVGAWTGILYKLAHAQDWWVKNNQAKGSIDISTIATGGVADIYVIQAQSPDDIVNNYFRLIGRPTMVPQWALGWNQCRWGYDTLDKLKAVVQGYDDNKLPLDVQWSDIDWMNKYRSFEFDQVNFKDLPSFVDDLHKSGRKYVPIVDAGIAYRPDSDYKAFQEALDQNLFTTINGEPFIGQVWPNDASFPDYTNPDTVKWFQGHLEDVHTQVAFDGLWEDMNEASNFCQGACYRNQLVDKPVKQNLPYTPTGRDLEIKSMPLDTLHSNGVLQLDAHSYYGTQEVKATHEYFQSKNMRTFIIERSSFAGMGKFASRWLGDNFSEDKFMGYSISGVMMMNIFGIPLAGADICGFIGDTNPELCARWHHVGAYYPFSRNHNNWGQVAQEPWAWGDLEYEPGQKYIDIFRSAIKLKYSLIRYYYTQLFKVSYYSQGTFYRPMFFEFPEDKNAYINVTQNVMLGDALKVSFNSEHQKQNITQFYFPVGIWCDIIRKTECIESTGQFYNMSTKVYETYLHLRNGYIVPWQEAQSMDFKTSKDLQDQPIELHILGDPAAGKLGYLYWEARGNYVNDDGETLDVTGNFNGYNFIARADGDLELLILPTFQATNYMGKFDKGCTAVNQNDYLGKVYFYYAKALQIDITYNVKASFYNSQITLDMGQATLEQETDRLKWEPKSALCMNIIKQITFTKA